MSDAALPHANASFDTLHNWAESIDDVSTISENAGGDWKFSAQMQLKQLEREYSRDSCWHQFVERCPANHLLLNLQQEACWALESPSAILLVGCGPFPITTCWIALLLANPAILRAGELLPPRVLRELMRNNPKQQTLSTVIRSIDSDETVRSDAERVTLASGMSPLAIEHADGVSVEMSVSEQCVIITASVQNKTRVMNNVLEQWSRMGCHGTIIVRSAPEKSGLSLLYESLTTRDIAGLLDKFGGLEHVTTQPAGAKFCSHRFRIYRNAPVKCNRQLPSASEPCSSSSCRTSNARSSSIR